MEYKANAAGNAALEEVIVTLLRVNGRRRLAWTTNIQLDKAL